MQVVVTTAGIHIWTLDKIVSAPEKIAQSTIVKEDWLQKAV